MVSIKYNDVYIKDWFSIAGVDEKEGKLKNINLYTKDAYYGEDTLEKAEIKMQKTVLNNLLSKNNFDLIIGGDLSNQLGTMNIALRESNKSFLGVYNACASFVEGMIMASSLISAKQVLSIGVLTSSHTLTSERQFRFPNEYGSLKACYSTSTITAAVGSVLTNVKTKLKIVSGTIGSVVDYGINDVYNMGAVMAPAAASVINAHLTNNTKSINDYDLILTGDLGSLGVDLVLQVLKHDYGITCNNLVDAGTLIYKEDQKKLMGGSGPSVIPLVLFNNILHNKKYKKILVVGTGALHNPTMINQKSTIPAIAHAIEIEVQL